MKKKVAIISNICIAVVLVGLGVAVFTTDLSNVFLSVSAPVYNGDRNGDQVSLMFVVEDDARFLPEILELLEERDTPATFFVGGKWASSNRAALLSIASNDKFELGNHAYNNRSLARLNESAQRKEIQNNHSLVKAITSGTQLNTEEGNEIREGVCMKLFLPPNGSFNKTTLKVAERLDYRTVMWSRDATTGSIFDKAVDGIRSGDLVLLRPSLATFASLIGILTEYGRKGFDVVKVSENIS